MVPIATRPIILKFKKIEFSGKKQNQQGNNIKEKMVVIANSTTNKYLDVTIKCWVF